MDDLISRLRALSRHEHSDYSIGDEAADALEAAQAERKVIVAESLKYADKVERLARALREVVALGHPRDPAIIAAKNALHDHDQEVGNG